MAKLTRKQIKEGLDQIPIDGLLFGTPDNKAIGAKLTAKQREFARMIALGESKAGAYRKSYNSKGTPKTQAANGHKLSKRTDIAQTTEAFIQAQRFAECHTPAQIRAFVIQQLVQHASDEEFPPATRAKCLELLGKVAEVGAFVDRKEVVSVQSSQTIREKLAERLKLIGISSTQDARDHEQDAADADSLLAELTPPPVESTETDTHPDPIPAILGGDCAEDTHSIPHKQSGDIPHKQSSPTAYIVDGEWSDSTVSLSIDASELPQEDGRASSKSSPQQVEVRN